MAKYKIIPSSRTIVQSPISIGHKAEKGVEAIEFDLTAWVETYGSGTLTVVMRRWGDAIPYPIALEIDENNKATWTLSDIDTAKAGMAYAQLSYIVGDEVVKKSDIYTFRVMDSLTGEGDPPEAYESWLEHLTHLAAEAMAEVLDIEGIVTDKTLTVDGGIADAKATGDALGALEDQFTEETDKLKADLNYSKTAPQGYILTATDEGNGTEWSPVGLPTDAQTTQAVTDWLDEHPEATTTVQDGSLIEEKFSNSLKLKTIKDYVTPEMYGAVGDGVTDDSTAIQNAIDSGKPVKLSAKTYMISSPLYVDWYTTIFGDSAGWNRDGTVIKASNDFSGDYMLIISHNSNDYCRSVNICDINLNCNSITGGINAIHLYDASIFKNINITRIGANHYGINIEYKGHVTQTLTCLNVICVADTATQRDGTKAIIRLERLQESTLINVRAFTNNSNAFDIFGCETLTMISCATYDYANSYKAFNFGIYSKEGFAPHYIRNITMIGCLNEGNPMGLCVNGIYQTLTGTFTEYSAGSVVTQNDVKGVVASSSVSSLVIYPINGEFVTGVCSAGEITAITNRHSDGFEIDYQPKLNDAFSSVTVKGVSNSTIKVNKTIGYNTGVDYTVENNYCAKIVVAPDDVHSINTDYTSEISSQSPVVLFTGNNGSNISGLPNVAFDGLTVIIYSIKDKYDCRLTLPIASIYNGTKSLGFNYFTKAVLKVVKGYFAITECDGNVLDKTNNIFVWNGDVKKTTLTSQTTSVTGFMTNMHYINAEAQQMYTININGSFVGRKIVVTSVNTYAITVNLGHGATLPDGTTKSVVVNAGETKTFISLTSGIFNVQ